MNTHPVKKALHYVSPFWRLFQNLNSLLIREYQVIPIIFHDIPKGDENKFRNILILAQSMNPFISPNDFEAVMNGNKKLTQTHFLLTFDDGFYSNRIVAEKILKQLGIKAVFFVCSKFIGLPKDKAITFVNDCLFPESVQKYKFSEGKIAMDWNDLKWLLKEGHSIGAHTANHVSLSSIQSEETYQSEVIESANLLEKILNVSIRWFAFPFGDISSINRESLQKIWQRYQFCFSGIRGANYPKTHPSVLRRESISLTDDYYDINMILKGAYAPFYFFKRKQLDAFIPQNP